MRGLPVRVVISGTQAIIGYYSDAPVVIESSTGLTDRRIAHQKLERRGRVGHEKAAPLSYLIDVRRAHLIVGRSRVFDDSLAAYAPVLHLGYRSLEATLLTWDPPIMAEFRRRGAEFDDFMPVLDRFIAALPRMPDSVAAAAYAQARRFYFDGVRDPQREAAFRRRLASHAGS